MGEFNLESYLSNGVENIVKGIVKASVKNPKASLFFAGYILDSKRARKVREAAKEKGEHIPPFLIASITRQCNLHCKGCYARANHSCVDKGAEQGVLTAKEWKKIFDEAADLGVSFILLAGGEPFVRNDVLEAAGDQKKILFPIFTNGTLIDQHNLQLLKKNRNLLPVLSIEGNEETTDTRRGQGIYQKLQMTMKTLQEEGILYGASITVTTENMQEVLSKEFAMSLQSYGCKAVVYVEYVPMEKQTIHLALEDSEREQMTKQLDDLRVNMQEMLFISFPGDEKSSGGCLAAGRGFFHINASGGAEPCPFSPYSDTNVVKVTLKEALKSPLFVSLQKNGYLNQEHIGGCVLFEQEEQVRALIN